MDEQGSNGEEWNARTDLRSGADSLGMAGPVEVVGAATGKANLGGAGSGTVWQTRLGRERQVGTATGWARMDTADAVTLAETRPLGSGRSPVRQAGTVPKWNAKARRGTSRQDEAGKMKRETPERKQQRAFYRVLRVIYLALHPKCECGCGREASEIHHKAGCEGWLLCAMQWFMGVCRPCHKWITANGKHAARNGWKIEVPVLSPQQRQEIKQRACELYAKVPVDFEKLRYMDTAEARSAILEAINK